MPRIENPLYNSKTQTALVNPGSLLSPGAVDQANRQVAGASQDFLNQTLATMDSFQQQYKRAELIAQEKEFQNSLFKLIPEAMKEIGGTMTNAIDKMTQLDQAQYNQEIKVLQNAYLLDKTGELQTQFNSAQAEFGDDPSKMMGWVNSTIEKHLGLAPDEWSKIKYLEAASKFKVNALDSSMQTARAKRSAHVGGTMDKYVNQLAQQALNDPNGDIMASLSSVGGMLASTGMDNNQVGQALIPAKNQIREAQINGHLQQGDPYGAANKLSNPGLQSEMDPSKYANLVHSTSLEALKLEMQKKVTAKDAMALNMFENGTLSPNMDSANRASYIHYLNFEKTLGLSPEVTNEGNFRQQAGALSQYFLKYNKFAGSDTTGYITSQILTSPNPHNVAKYATTLDTMMNAPEFKGLNIANSFNKDALTQASMISSLVNSGVDPREAVIKVRDSFNNANPALEDRRKKEVNDYLKDNKALNNLQKQFNPWLGKNPDNLPQFEAEYTKQFQAFYVKTGDVDQAAKLAKTSMGEKYAVTSVFEGERKLMYGAPDKYLSSKDLDGFKDGLTKAIGSKAVEIGGSMDKDGRTIITADGKKTKVGITSVYGYNYNDPANGKRPYLLTNADTGEILIGSNGAPLMYEYGFNQGNYDAAKKAELERLATEGTKKSELPSDEQIKGKILNTFTPLLDKLTPDQKDSIIRSIRDF